MNIWNMTDRSPNTIGHASHMVQWDLAALTLSEQTGKELLCTFTDKENLYHKTKIKIVVQKYTILEELS